MPRCYCDGFVIGLASLLSFHLAIADEIRVGVLSTWMGGVWKKPGFLLAIKPAIDRINNDTSILPNDHLTFLLADTQCQTRYAAEAAAWLLASDVDVIIGSPCSGDCELFVPMVTYKHVPVISYYAVSPVLSNKQVYPAFARVVGTTLFYDKVAGNPRPHYNSSNFNNCS